MQLQISLPSPTHRPSFVPTPRTRRFRVSAGAAAAVTMLPTATTMYELLSVAETAGPEEIKSAYRLQARRWHPDACRSAGDERRYAERFMRTREAYEVLSDPARRRSYDLSLSADRWAAAVGAAAAFRSDDSWAARGRGRGEGFGDWEAQLEGLRRRSEAAAGEETWAGRMRRRARRAESAA